MIIGPVQGSVTGTLNWKHIVVAILNVVASDSSTKVSRRRVSSEDTALIVKCIPDEYCSILQLKRHFAEYGVTRVIVNSRHHSATVFFKSHVNSICWFVLFADRTALISYWHHTVVCLSVRPVSICLNLFNLQSTIILQSLVYHFHVVEGTVWSAFSATVKLLG